jgi:NitT/TauT family transport system permease protein
MPAAALALVVVLAWELSARVWVSIYRPPASSVAAWIWKDFRFLAWCAAATSLRALTGMVAGVMIGGILGMGMALSRPFSRVVRPFSDFLRSVPGSALILLFAMWFGLDWPAVLVTMYGCIWPVLSNTSDAMNSVSVEVRQTLDILRVSRLRQFTEVYSRQLLPGFLAGVRIAVSVALILTVTTELVIAPAKLLGFAIDARSLGAPRSDLSVAIGGYLQYQYEAGAVAGVLAAVVVGGLLGWGLNWSYQVCYTRLLRRLTAASVDDE